MVAISVAPLVWESLAESKNLIARTPFGNWMLLDLGDTGWIVQTPFVNPDIGDARFGTRETAREMAEADYARRVRKCTRPEASDAAFRLILSMSQENFLLRRRVRERRARVQRLQALCWILGAIAVLSLGALSVG